MQIARINDYRDYTNTDSEIVTKIIAGETGLYEVLLRRNNQLLFRVVRSYLTNHEDIQDVMQNTYLKAYVKLHQFKHKSKFSTWLIRIGINEALARLKQKGKLVSLKEDGDLDIDKQVIRLFDHQKHNPERKVILEETKRLLEKAIDNLDTKYRNVYIMRLVEDMSVAEIAECLKITPSNVKVRLHRAKTKLKENLYEMIPKSELFEFGANNCDTIVTKVYSNLEFV
ncbi:MAG: RNA polymerase sigma factor [Flavobacteriaceae bacterium]|nr:RNA polymerase sigma factor [Flavobacteriaceae bacterium]